MLDAEAGAGVGARPPPSRSSLPGANRKLTSGAAAGNASKAPAPAIPRKSSEKVRVDNCKRSQHVACKALECFDRGGTHAGMRVLTRLSVASVSSDLPPCQGRHARADLPQCV